MTSTISLHFKKHKYGSTGLKKHVERLPGQQHSNKNIKNHLTKDNIFLAGNRDLSYQNRINNIIKYQLNGKKTRKDAVKLVTTTVQLGGDAKNKDKSDQISALKSAFELLKEDIGEKILLVLLFTLTKQHHIYTLILSLLLTISSLQKLY